MAKVMKKYNPKKYNPSLGGHSQGHLREVFLQFIEMGGTDEINLNSTLSEEYGENQFTLGEIIGLLWNCTDVLPRMEYDTLRQD